MDRLTQRVIFSLNTQKRVRAERPTGNHCRVLITNLLVIAGLLAIEQQIKFVFYHSEPKTRWRLTSVSSPLTVEC